MSKHAGIPDGSIHLEANLSLVIVTDWAVKFGLNEAIVLRQLRFLQESTSMGRVVDGDRWIYNSYDVWREKNFPFWSIATIQRAFSSLESKGLIKSRTDLNKNNWDRTKWYALDRENPAFASSQKPYEIASYQNDTIDLSPENGDESASYHFDMIDHSNLISSSYAENTTEKERADKSGTPVDSDLEKAPVVKTERKTNPTFEIASAIYRTLGVDIGTLPESVKKKQFAVAKRLANDGMTATEAVDVTRWLMGDTWQREKGIDVMTVEIKRSAYISATAGKSTNFQPNLTGTEPPKFVGYDPSYPYPHMEYQKELRAWRDANPERAAQMDASDV